MQNALSAAQQRSRRAQLQTLWQVLTRVVRDPRVLANLIDYRAQMRAYVVDHYGLGDGLPTVDLLDLLPGFQETIDPYSFLEGTSLLTDLALLKALARRFTQCHYLEIGTWRGESIANVAPVAAECVSISLSPEEMRQSGYSQELIDAHNFFSRDIPNIRHIGHDSRTFDYSVFQDKFDLIFIDGDHTQASVAIDTRNAFSVLRHAESIIVWHDYGHSRYTVNWHILAGILDGCPAACRSRLYHVSNTLCAVYLPQPVAAAVVDRPQIPNKRFSVTLAATGN